MKLLKCHMNNFIKKCRRSLIFCIFIYSSLTTTAQTDNISLYPILEFKTGKYSLGLQSESCITENCIYWFTTEEWNPDNRELKIFSMSYRNSKTDTLLINIPDSIQIASLPMISVSIDFLILTDDYNFNQYRYVREKNRFRLLNQIKKPGDSPVNQVTHIINDLFLFECLYNFHPANKQHNTNLAIYDAKNNKLTDFIHPLLPCMAFSHLEKQWTAVSNSLIAVASPCDYKIFLYDLNMVLKDSIVFRPEGWKDLPGHMLPFETDPSIIHPKLLIKKLKSYEDSLSRIERIHFTDNNTLLVSSRNGHANLRNNELWKIGETKKPISSISIPIEYDENEIINKNRLKLQLQTPLRMDFRNNICIAFYDDDFFPIDSLRYSEFKKLKDTYYETNDPQFTISLFKINTH